MWIFGYGSLMWDGWEKEFNGKRVDGAVLKGWQRSFNKKSTREWGTPANPGPTLGLEPRDNAHCVGTAFHFDDAFTTNIVAYLKAREGRTFHLTPLCVVLPGGTVIHDAYTPVNDPKSNTYIGNLDIDTRVAMAKKASGRKGTSVEYARSTSAKLQDLKIYDEAVKEFVGRVSESDTGREMYCPKCGHSLRRQSNGELSCERGAMALSQHLERGLAECFVDKTRTPRSIPLPFPVGGSWFCPSCGGSMNEIESGLVICLKCDLSLGEFLHELIELHPHR